MVGDKFKNYKRARSDPRLLNFIEPSESKRLSKTLLTWRAHLSRHLIPITLQLESVPVASVTLIPKAFPSLNSFNELIHVFGTGAFGFSFHCERVAGAVSDERRGTDEASRPRPARASAAALALATAGCGRYRADATLTSLLVLIAYIIFLSESGTLKFEMKTL